MGNFLATLFTATDLLNSLPVRKISLLVKLLFLIKVILFCRSLGVGKIDGTKLFPAVMGIEKVKGFVGSLSISFWR